MSLLNGKKVLLAVTGSISAYKAPNIAREFIKAGATVRVMMSESAMRFISPLVFEAITKEAVLTETTESWTNDCNHIGFAKWADLIVVAPATANTINKLSNGIADNLLLQTILASSATKLIAPSANTQMIANHITTASLKLLKLNDFEIVTASGFLACGDEGAGRLADEKLIFWQGARLLLQNDFWRYRGVVISSGATIEPIDSVRAITNHSSGKMAKALANAAFVLGADVCMAGSRLDEILPICTIQTASSDELANALDQALREAKKGVMSGASLSGDNPRLIKKTPLFMMAAAVSDYRVKNPQIGKLKKDILGENWKLELVKNRDILASLDKSGVFSVGFKAEFDQENALANAKKMLLEKSLNAVCLNVLGDGVEFGSDQTQISLIRDDTKTFSGDKFAVAFELLKALEKEFD